MVEVRIADQSRDEVFPAPIDTHPLPLTELLKVLLEEELLEDLPEGVGGFVHLVRNRTHGYVRMAEITPCLGPDVFQSAAELGSLIFGERPRISRARSDRVACGGGARWRGPYGR